MARARCHTRREIACVHLAGFYYQFKEAALELCDDGDANIAEVGDETNPVVKNKNANSGRIRTHRTSPAGRIVIAT